jgi:hypothetical protein
MKIENKNEMSQFSTWSLPNSIPKFFKFLKTNMKFFATLSYFFKPFRIVKKIEATMHRKLIAYKTTLKNHGNANLSLFEFILNALFWAVFILNDCIVFFNLSYLVWNFLVFLNKNAKSISGKNIDKSIRPPIRTLIENCYKLNKFLKWI